MPSTPPPSPSASPAQPAPAVALSLQAFHNPRLPRGGDVVRVILRVQVGEADPAAGRPGPVDDRDRAEVLIIDVSRSMQRDLPAAKRAAAAAVASLGDGMAFAVVAGNDEAWSVWPPGGGSLAVASPSERAAAQRAIERLTSGGQTAMSTWLRHARGLLDGHPARFRHVVLLTDGHNHGDKALALTQAVDECRDVFRCDCRGLRDDWDVAQMRGVAHALQGRCDIVPTAADLAAELPALVADSRGRTVPDLRLRLQPPKVARIVSCEQVHPEIAPLLGEGSGAPSPPVPYERGPELRLGAWAPGEQRDYRVVIHLPPRQDHATVRAVRAVLVHGDSDRDGGARNGSGDRGRAGSEGPRADVTVKWTDHAETAARIDPVVAHYDGQTDLANAVADGLQALEQGDEPSAIEHLGRAVELSERHRNSETLAILSRIVDTSSGPARIRRQSLRLDRKVLQSRGSRTVTIVLPEEPEPGGASP